MTSGGEKFFSPPPLQNVTSTFLQCLEQTLMLDSVSAIFLRNSASSFLHFSLLATQTHLRKPCLALFNRYARNVKSSINIDFMNYRYVLLTRYNLTWLIKIQISNNILHIYLFILKKQATYLFIALLCPFSQALGMCLVTKVKELVCWFEFKR